MVGVGVDAIEIVRVRLALARTPSLVERLWTAAEGVHCTAPDGDLRVGSLATRFAAKEAVAKALGSGFHGFGFTDVEVVANADGKPEVVLHAGAAARAEEEGIARVHLSLSRTRDLALAQAVAVGAPR
ncbi:holo-[acyl-carrier-protein] synthase [Egibacter rhizosphaerae]|uniref:Holo-[acyl-carrier-protein] synthase n=1 Tax=Egibacter rhizosphaerae TaxID=1670831 RepID=A0A411YLI6_9ACTN|nr:holo-[acyl-carrier-protein] synthase [Egibacter rhizosphaerae]